MNKAYKVCVEKIRKNIELIGSDMREFVACEDGMYFNNPREKIKPIEDIGSWTSSFFTGMAYIAYQTEKDEKILKWLYSIYDVYADKVFKTPINTMHDLGFLYSPYSVALYKLTGDDKMRQLSLRAADILGQRFISKGEYIRAWGRMDDKVPSPEFEGDEWFTNSRGLAIIDCMMNLPLLFWAYNETGNTFYRDVACYHADTTKKLFIREDNSVYHAYRFDPQSGNPIGGDNYCGFDVESYWARGTAWAIYGFALAYSYTKNDEYKDVCIKISHKFINECEEDGIPVWDFRLPKDKPAMNSGNKEQSWDVTKNVNTKYNRDSSAATVAVCGFMEICKHIKDEKIEKQTGNIMNSLINKYLDDNLSVSGILKCQNGNMTYTSFGDYYFMEALARSLYDIKVPW